MRALGADPSSSGVRGLALQLGLNPFPMRLIDDGCVTPFLKQGLVSDLTDVDRVGQKAVQASSGKGLPTASCGRAIWLQLAAHLC